MRATAQLTGGRYLFLTDDSGVGGSHLEPSIPCYFVTRLNDAMLRMVDIEMSGEYREPDPATILRTGGDPRAGPSPSESRSRSLHSGLRASKPQPAASSATIPTAHVLIDDPPRTAWRGSARATEAMRAGARISCASVCHGQWAGALPAVSCSARRS